MSADNNELPSHKRLLALLRMTESSTDNEALTAVRMANALLRREGWDWEKLLTAKIKIVGDPFVGMRAPPKPKVAEPPRPTPGYAQPVRRSQSAPSPANNPSAGVGIYDCAICHAVHVPVRGAICAGCHAASQAKPTPQPSVFPRIDSQRPNAYPGLCYCCGDPVDATAGWIFKPADFTPNASTGRKSEWAIACTSCNSSRYPNIGTRPASRKTPQWSDIGNL